MSRFRRVARDPHWLTTKYASKQSDGSTVPAGARVWYYPSTRTMLTGEAAEQAAAAFQGQCDDEAFYQGLGA